MSQYKKAGVDIEAGNKLVDIIKPLAKSTKRLGSDTEIGGFGALFDLAKINYKDPILVSTTDGVGTKLKIAIEMGIYEHIGQDLVAMCANDLIVQGAEPLFFLDYFATGKLELDVASKVIASIAMACKECNMALIGGETAEMPGMYNKDDFDLAGFAVGVVERNNILPKEINKGDVILGLASSGVHSNGFSLVRYILKNQNMSYQAQAEFAKDKTIGEILLTPTKLYVRSVLKALKSDKIKAIAHITGGGFIDNIPRILPSNFDAEIDLSSFELPEIFSWLKKVGNLSKEEMITTFNSGIGLILVVDKNDVDEVTKILHDMGENVSVIGKIIDGNQKVIPRNELKC